MQMRLDQLDGHLQQAAQRGLRPVYTVWGDEALLQQEACDAIRGAALAAGYGERQVHTVAGAHFDWSGLLGQAQAMSLFSDRQLVEIRIPSGKPGKDGSDALQRYCEHLGPDVLTLVQLPRLDRQQQQSAWFGALVAAGIAIRVDPIERHALPAWLAQRLARQGQRVKAGADGERALAFFADQIEGNLLAAHQEIQKLGLLYPPGELGFEQFASAVLDVARYDIGKFSESVLAGQVGRALHMLDALQAEGEAAVLVHWSLAEDIRALKRCRDALDNGKPLPMALREARVWGAKERLYERALPALDAAALSELVAAAQICDGLVKGLRHPQWPLDAWPALRRLTLMLLQLMPAASTQRGQGQPPRFALGG
ncbi:DNA polymerase III subunit delta [Piscinibacter sakaiensis]|uniref:DNA polymerase III subunit delta n=1 Tax=Piscinibacter sakaiensis TaxID=1547922 RepID=UPI003AAD0C68